MRTYPVDSRPRRRSRRDPSAFTIVEVLVVIGIVAIMASLLMVGLKALGGSARAAACLTRLRELSNAHLSYSNLYQECFVDVGLPHGSSGDPKRSFVTTLRDFGIQGEALVSPLDLSPHWPPESGDGAPVAIVQGTPLFRRTSYGMNNHLSRSYSPALATGSGAPADRLARVRRPSEVACFLLMAERGAYASSDHPHVENWGAVSNPALLASTQCSINAVDRKRASGDSRSNWSFVDGHVATLRFDEVFTSANKNQLDPGL